MNKRSFYPLVLSLMVLFISCSSIPSNTSFIEYPKENTFYVVEIGEIGVSLDKVTDPDISEQLYNIIETMLYPENEENSIKTKLDMQIVQRSFFYKIEQKNSIYVSYVLTKNDGDVLLQEGFYYETAHTVLSSKEQYKIAKKISKNINKYLEKSRTVIKEKKSK